MKTTAALQTRYSHLVCAQTNERYDPAQLQTYSRAHQPLLARYQLSAGFSQAILRERNFDMWRYREVLPVIHEQNITTLQEGGTPLLRLRKAEDQLQIERLYYKDEAGNPSGSFKARGLSMAISKAKELGVRACVIPTAGNAGGAMSAYCALAGLEAHVYMPRATPQLFQQECRFYGAEVSLVDGNISDCARRIQQEKEDHWFDISTLKEPFRLEGKKTMGYEMAEQLAWKVPDVIIYPTGGGTGLIGIWKAMEEMEELGWIDSKRPRMVAVQIENCCPIVRAFAQKEKTATPFPNPGITIANGLRVPAAFGDRLILDILHRSQGQALAVSEADMHKGIQELAQLEGCLPAPEGAAVWAACKRLRNTEWIKAEESVVLLNTGSAYKYMENL